MKILIKTLSIQTKWFAIFGLVLFLLTGCGKATLPVLSATPEPLPHPAGTRRAAL